MAENDWERELIRDLAQDYMKEKRTRRRWRLFFRLAFLLLTFLVIVNLFLARDKVGEDLSKVPHTALIDVEGVISYNAKANADNLARALRTAYEDSGTKAILLRINSPGGSPVQANYIFQEIRRLKAKHKKIKVYAVCTDICASAAYYIAAAADDVYADPASLVGSIGVLYNGFGFVGAMDKVGIERRLITAGTNKGFMDPFSNMVPGQKQKLEAMLKTVHKEFIDSVKQGRGKRLQSNPDLFSGLIWSGRRAKSLGLVDGFGSPGQVARDVIKQEKLVDYTVRKNYFEKLAEKMSMSFSNGVLMQFGVSQSPVQAIYR